MNRAGARKKNNAKNPSPARLTRDFAHFAVSKIEMKSQRATAPAERKRSRSEAHTGRRTGASFGLCLFLGRENRLRFSCRAGPSFGLEFGPRANSAIPFGIAVLGRSDAIAARGGRAEDEPNGLGNKENVAFAVRRTAGLVAQRRSRSGGGRQAEPESFRR